MGVVTKGRGAIFCVKDMLCFGDYDNTDMDGGFAIDFVKALLISFLKHSFFKNYKFVFVVDAAIVVTIRLNHLLM